MKETYDFQGKGLMSFWEFLLSFSKKDDLRKNPRHFRN